MKKVLLGLTTLALVGALVLGTPQVMARDGAQGGQGGNYEKKDGQQGENAERLMKAMTEHLQLTQAQQDKIKPIVTDMVNQINAIKAGSGQNHEEKQKKAMEVRNAAYDKIAAELTPEQKAKFDKHRAGMQGPKEAPKDKK